MLGTGKREHKPSQRCAGPEVSYLTVVKAASSSELPAGVGVLAFASSSVPVLLRESTHPDGVERNLWGPQGL